MSDQDTKTPRHIPIRRDIQSRLIPNPQGNPGLAYHARDWAARLNGEPGNPAPVTMTQVTNALGTLARKDGMGVERVGQGVYRYNAAHPNWDPSLAYGVDPKPTPDPPAEPGRDLQPGDLLEVVVHADGKLVLRDDSGAWLIVPLDGTSVG